jgi:hypothetical protein
MTLRGVLVTACCLLLATTARAQVQTGAITGVVSDVSGAVLPGVTATLSGDRLIGGDQVLVSDAAGAYRFDRLPPGDYRLRFELTGFKVVERADIRISAAFVATINARMEVGGLEETITVTGASPTVDVRSRPVVAGQDHPRCAGCHLRRRRDSVDAAEQHVGARVQHGRRQLHD